MWARHLVMYRARQLRPMVYRAAEPPPDDDFQLADGHWQTSIFAVDLWYPRTDADRTADGNGTAPVWAYHKRGLLGMTRVIPLGVVGNPPWWVTINGGPPGMTVDNDPDSATYSTLTIPNSETYSGTIDITIHGQGGATTNKTWSYETSNTASHFVFVDTSAGGGGTGTSASPFDSIADVLTTDDQDETYLGRQVIITGTTTLAGLAVEYNGVYVKINGHKPAVWIAGSGGHTFRGSASNNPSVTTDASAFDFDGGDGSDFVFAGHNWINPRICYVNGSEFRNIFVDTASSDMEYGGFFFNDFDLDAAQGTSGANSTPIFLANNENYDGFVTFYGNNFHDGPFLGPITIYDTHHLWCGKNTMNGIESANGWYLKGGNNLEDYAFYFNSGTTGNTGAFSKIDSIDFEGLGPWSRRRIEFMHNIWKSTGANARGIWDVGFTGFEHIISSKRNNWKVPNHRLNSSDLITGSATFDFDVIESTSGTEGVVDDGTTLGFTIARGDNLETGLDDTTAAQTSPTGTHGAEVL